MTVTNFRASVRTMLRDRLLDAAEGLIVSEGWASLTMSKVAECGGVSRQTVYNELGSKPAIADALVARKLDLFLGYVGERMVAESDVVEAIRAAAEGAMEMAHSEPLLRAILESVGGGNTELLPYLTTDSQGLLDVATEVVMATIIDRFDDIGLDDDQFRSVTDALVRLVFSHVVRSSKPAAEAADEIAWLATRILRA